MVTQLFGAVVLIPFHGWLFDRPVLVFHLPIGPSVIAVIRCNCK